MSHRYLPQVPLAVRQHRRLPQVQLAVRQHRHRHLPLQPLPLWPLLVSFS